MVWSFQDRQKSRNSATSAGSPPTGVAIALDGSWLGITSTDKTARVWTTKDAIPSP